MKGHSARDAEIQRQTEIAIAGFARMDRGESIGGLPRPEWSGVKCQCGSTRTNIFTERYLVPDKRLTRNGSWENYIRVEKRQYCRCADCWRRWPWPH